MSDGIRLTISDDGVATLYDDTYDITIHCESKEEQDEVKRRFMSEPTCSPANFREKVFEIIDKVRAMYPYRIAGRSDTYDSYNEAWRDCADQIEVQIEAYLKDVPEKNVGEWIPCGKRMPEEHEWIGTETFGTTISDEVYVTFESPKGERFTKHLNFQNGKVPSFVQRNIDAFYKGSVPIAWKPLPEPYWGNM